MKRWQSKRVASRLAFLAQRGIPDVDRAINVRDFAHLVAAARRKGKTVAIVNGPARDHARGIHQSRVVLEPQPTIPLFGQAGDRGEIVGTKNLNPRGPRDDYDGSGGQQVRDRSQWRNHERLWRPGAARDGQCDADRGAIGQHR